jgi:hypothetical protein
MSELCKPLVQETKRKALRKEYDEKTAKLQKHPNRPVQLHHF